MSEKESNFVDLGVHFPLRKNKVTTAIEVGLFKEGVEIAVEGYRRHQLNHMRTMFMPSTGEMVFEIQCPQFGEIAKGDLPLEVDALAMFARDGVFGMRPFKHVLTVCKLEVIRVPWMKVQVVA